MPLARHPELGHEPLHRREDRVVPAARAPAHLLVGLEVLRRQRRARRCRSPSRIASIASASSPERNGSPRTLVVADGVDQELGADRASAAARGSSRARARGRSARRTSPRLRGNGFRWRRWAWATLPPCFRSAAPPRRSSRTVPPQPSTSSEAPVGIVDLELGDVGRDPGDLLRAQAHHVVVVVGVVGDVAGHVLLLEPADAVLEARRPGNRPRRARASPGRARTAGTRRRGSARSRTRPGSPAASRRRGGATARSRSRGTRRRAGTPACGT